MTDRELFLACQYSGAWKTVGDDVQYKIENGTLFFQPSSSAIDWRVNLNFPATAYRDSPVPWMAHRGFIRAWKQIRDEVLADDSVIQIVGYSHGAALALLAHEDILFTTEIHLPTVLFGCPRVVWARNFRHIKHRWDGVRNIQVRGDLVTRVPPWSLGYRHVGSIERLGPWSIPLPRCHAQDAYLKYLEG